MRHSTVATKTIPGQSVTRPKVTTLIVDITRSSAGLAPGKYFRTPKPRKTAPTETRRAIALWPTSQRCRAFSTAMSRRMAVPAGTAFDPGHPTANDLPNS